MRAIILVTSCDRDCHNGRQEAAEETWMRAWGDRIDHKFVIGRGPGQYIRPPWELLVEAPDDYAGVPFKMQEARRWALDHQYDYVFQACVDTWIHVPRLMTSGFENYDYSGYEYQGNASGGLGYWTSTKAISVLLDANVEEARRCVWEDVWVGRTLAKAGITLHHNTRYSSPRNDPVPEFPITMHLSRATGHFDPQWMYECHERYK